MNVSPNTNLTDSESKEQKLQQIVDRFIPLLFVWGGLGIFSIISNAVFLLLSKFTTGGKSPVLVFMRSICWADAMLGLYAIIKAIVFYSMQTTKVNCFLPDSLLITATTAFVFTLVWLHADCCLRFTHPLKYILHMKKTNIITGMVFLWNISFVLGFLPLMGWNNADAVCAYENFFSVEYVCSIISLWCVGLLSTVVMEIILKLYIEKVKHNQHLLTINSREFQRFQNLIWINRIELIGWLSCIVLVGIFIIISVVMFSDFIYFHVIEVHILCIVPIFLLRSCIISVVRSYKTTQIHIATKKLRRQVTSILQKHPKASKVNSATDTIRSNLDSNKSTEVNNSLKASFRKGTKNGDNTNIKDGENSQQRNSQRNNSSCPRDHSRSCTESITAVDNPLFNMADEVAYITSLPVSCKNGLLILETESHNECEVTHL
ncbi:adenosine receptor A1-like [Saccostrea echinata]|uniref:adenosine receptor A1-like n=1 Tax=Saccostrea echinata TaxID=191078 RepID=UPI002A8213F9|nr:adenosine receptor A1-like [Saccostrea echinata]